MAKMRVRLTLLEEILGTAPNGADVYGTYYDDTCPFCKKRKEDRTDVHED